jgi:TonB family protein
MRTIANCGSIASALILVVSSSVEAGQEQTFAGFRVIGTVEVSASIKTDPADSAQTSVDTSYVLNWVSSKGKVQGAQIVKSSGYPRLDEAALHAMVNGNLVPGTQDGTAVESWGITITVWRLMGGHSKMPVAGEPIAILSANQTLNVAALIDSGAPLHDTICGGHLKVSPAGAADLVTLSLSTGSPKLDKICIEALRPLKFTPAQLDGQAVSGVADVWLGLSTTETIAAPADAPPPNAITPKIQVETHPR